MLVISAIALASLICALIVFLWHTTTSGPPKAVRQAQRPQGGGRAQRLRRRQARAAGGATDAPAGDASGNNDASEANEAGTSHSKKSAKKRAKEARRQAALAQHSSTEPEDGVRGAAVLQEQPEPTVHKSAYQIAREQRDAERTAEELAEAEEIRLAQEARQKREAAEFEAWKGLISVDGAGEDAASEAQLRQRRQELCDRLKTGRIVELETLSEEFGLSCSEVVSEIQELEEQGTVTGIMDERGKYIYFSMDELKQLAQIIQSKGRISIAEVAREASAMLMAPAAGVEGNDTGGNCTEEVLGGLIAA